MKTRVVSAIVAVILLLVVLLLGQKVIGTAVFLLSLVGINEFYNAVAKDGIRPVRIVGYIFCLPILVLALSGYVHIMQVAGGITPDYVLLAICAAIMILFSLMVFKKDKYNPGDIAITVMGILYVPFLFMFLVMTRNIAGGEYFIWFIFIGAWITDTFALLAGRAFGKRKLIPAVSPKKTVEGSVGGVLGCIAAMLVYGLILTRYELVAVTIDYYHFLILGLLCGGLSQVGDLAASSIKRYAGIKDFGSLMPGHGGVLDRFDSILFVGPVVYFYISFFIL